MRHVLVAVFEPAVRKLVSEVLEIEGYHVTWARDQDQLIAVLRSALHPPVVLLDVWAIEGGPTFSDQFLAAFVAEHYQWERHAYIVTGGDAHFVVPQPSPSAERFLVDHAAATLPMPFLVEALLAAVETAIARPSPPGRRVGASKWHFAHQPAPRHGHLGTQEPSMLRSTWRPGRGTATFDALPGMA